jgi:hypothetical protein
MATIQQEVLDLVHKVAPANAVVRGASKEKLSEFESRTKVVLPSTVREWLGMCNGCLAGPGGLYGIAPVPPNEYIDIEATYEIEPLWKQQKLIPVAGDGCGSYYLIPTQQEYGPGCPVLFFDHEDGLDKATYIAASDIWMFIRFLLNEELGEESWPYDREYVVQSDPGILAFSGVRRPWDRE